jgi:uncharacterized DUF497 family protein
MQIDFDPDKDRLNVHKHGVSLSLGKGIIAAAGIVLRDARFDYGEERFVAFGKAEGRLHVCVFTVRGDTTRVISVRKANDREVKRYDR